MCLCHYYDAPGILGRTHELIGKASVRASSWRKKSVSTLQGFSLEVDLREDKFRSTH